MNIFFLDKSPMLAAKYLADVHVVSQTKETGQLLSTAHRMYDGIREDRRVYYTNGTSRRNHVWEFHSDPVKNDLLPKVSHRNHPITLWVRSSRQNYNWAACHFNALLFEYRLRYGKSHKYESIMEYLDVPPYNMRTEDFSRPPNGAIKGIESNDQFKTCDPVIGFDGLVKMYREYYIGKETIMTKDFIWSKGERPSWMVPF